MEVNSLSGYMGKIVLYIVYFPIDFEKFLACYLTGLYFIVFFFFIFLFLVKM